MNEKFTFALLNQPLMKPIFIILLLFVLVPIYAQTTRTWTGNGDATSWTDPVNWDCNCVPSTGEDVVIPVFYSSVNINVSGAQDINQLNCWANLIIQSGAILTTHSFTYIQPGCVVTVNGTLNLTGCFDVWFRANSTFGVELVNNGTINVTDSHLWFFSDNGTGIPSFVNNGTFNISNNSAFPLYAMGLDNNATFQNNSSGYISVNANLGINMSGATVAASFANYGLFSGNGINSFKQIINQSSGTINISSYLNIYDTYYRPPVEIFSSFINEGTLNVTNPLSGGFYGLLINPGASFVSNGIVNINSERFPIDNQGMCALNGTTTLNVPVYNNYYGIKNSGTFSLANSGTSFYSNTNFLNLSSGNFTIDACKVISLYSLYNQGTTLNNGQINLDNTNLFYSSITQIGSFMNNGIISYSAYPIVLSPLENQGIFVQKVFGDHCVNTQISDFLSGEKVDISNLPTSGVFTDPGLTNSAGSLNWSSNTFTPSNAAIGLDVLYINIKKSGCDNQIIPIYFEIPINSGIWYEDFDYDNFGNASSSVTSCTQPLGYVNNSSDCDDTDPEIYPGAPELCNDKDYNCDGMLSPAMPSPSIWYKDDDFDGFGNPLVFIVNCSGRFGYVSNMDDCNDQDFNTHPGAIELCDNIDNDCDGFVDEGLIIVSTIFNNSGADNDWSNPLNWTNGVPATCVDAIIPSGYTVNLSVPGLECRSLTIATGSILNLNSAFLTVNGSPSAGILNDGTINLSNFSGLYISNTLGNGFSNNNIFNASIYNSISLNNIGGHGIYNSSSASFNSPDYLNVFLFGVDFKGINNLGDMTLAGYIGGSNINSNIIYNAGNLTKFGNIDLQNGQNLTDWVIYNSGDFHVNSGYITFPTPSIGANVSDKGIYMASGSSFDNSGTIYLFGNRISGPGMFINHGIVEGL